MHTFDQLYQPTTGVDAMLRPHLEKLHQCLAHTSADLPSLREAIIGVLEFLVSPRGRTDVNCRAVDSFLMLDGAWDANRLPQSFVDVLSDMSGALHDTVSAADIAANFESTPEQLLERARRL